MNAHFIFLIFFTLSVIKPVNIPNINRYIGMGLFVLISLWFLFILFKKLKPQERVFQNLFKHYPWEIAAIVLFLGVNVFALLMNLHRFDNLTLLVFYGLASFAVWLIFPMSWVIFQYSHHQNYRWIGWGVMLFIALVALWQIVDMSSSWQLRQYFVAADARSLVTSVTRWHTIYGAIAAIIALVCLNQLFSVRLLSGVGKAERNLSFIRKVLSWFGLVLAILFFLLLAVLAIYTGVLGESRNFFFTLGVGLVAMCFKFVFKSPKTTVLIVALAIIGTHWLVINNNRVAQDYGRVLPYLGKLNQGKPITAQDFVPKFNNSSMSGRISFWQRGISLWKESPYVGIGAGSFRASSHQKYFNLHNYYLQVLVDAGSIGVISLVFLLILLIRRAYFTGNFMIFIAVLGSLVFDNYLDYSMGWVLCMVWLLMEKGFESRI